MEEVAGGCLATLWVQWVLKEDKIGRSRKCLRIRTECTEVTGEALVLGQEGVKATYQNPGARESCGPQLSYNSRIKVRMGSLKSL